MALTVADSDVLIDALRGRSPAAERPDGAIGPGTLATTAITAFELRSGVRSERAASQVETLLAPLDILPLDEESAERAAAIRHHLEGVGTPIGMADYLIAGICLARSAVLLTRNRSRFKRVPNLKVGDLDAS